MGNENSENAFLILPSDFIQISPFLQEGGCYRLCHNIPLKQTSNKELVRIQKCKIYQIGDERAYFQLLNSAETQETILTVEKCKENVMHSLGLISFTGVLKQKRFADNFPSQAHKSSIYGFGTPGSRVPQLVFSSAESKTDSLLDCYLNNWENTLMPLGLIPQARVIVRNVWPQSKKYLKSSVFTSFEILSYEPMVDFQTANLFGNFELDWGPPFFLGHGNRIPNGVIIWGRVLSIQIISLEITNACKSCRYVNGPAGPCFQCGRTEKRMEFYSRLHVSDVYGQSKVLVDQPEFLKVIFDLQEKQFQIWMNAFEEIGRFDFNLFNHANEVETNNATERDLFRSTLSKYLTKLNQCAIQSLDMKCRKLESSSHKNGGRPLWFCMDVRKN
ncbi:hypothetical protein JTB14_036099 [Gonioctena quinquepunctata]|nr:hypothetical protein JTB14_036099 [Gonioctena quinquepunctata]